MKENLFINQHETVYNSVIESLLQSNITDIIFKTLTKDRISMMGDIDGIKYYALLCDSQDALFFTFKVTINNKLVEVADFSLGGYDYSTSDHHYGIYQRRGWWVETVGVSKKSQSLYNRLSKKFIKSFEKFYLTK